MIGGGALFWYSFRGDPLPQEGWHVPVGEVADGHLRGSGLCVRHAGDGVNYPPTPQGPAHHLHRVRGGFLHPPLHGEAVLPGVEVQPKVPRPFVLATLAVVEGIGLGGGVFNPVQHPNEAEFEIGGGAGSPHTGKDGTDVFGGDALAGVLGIVPGAPLARAGVRGGHHLAVVDSLRDSGTMRGNEVTVDVGFKVGVHFEETANFPVGKILLLRGRAWHRCG